MSKKLTTRERDLLKRVKKIYVEDRITLTAKIEDIIDIDPLIDFENYDGNVEKTAKFMIDSVRNLILDEDIRVKELDVILLEPQLPQELKKVLDEIGDTPQKEPEISNIEKDDALIEFINTKFNIDLNNFSVGVRDAFAEKVGFKVKGLTDSKGFVKHTEHTKKFSFLTNKERQEILKIIQDEQVEDNDTLEIMIKKQDNVDKKSIKLLSKTRKSLFKDATDWEKRLMVKEAITQIISPEHSFNMGF